jgi:hypothetical protein
MSCLLAATPVNAHDATSQQSVTSCAAKNRGQHGILDAQRARQDHDAPVCTKQGPGYREKTKLFRVERATTMRGVALAGWHWL